MAHDTARHILAAMLAEKTMTGELAGNGPEEEKSASELLSFLLDADSPPDAVSRGLAHLFDAAGGTGAQPPENAKPDFAG